jgi:predicted nuclease of predicted toxin-antitoxin system
MKLLIDMNLSPAWVNVFADNNISAVHWSSIGRADTPDVEIMAYAKANNYAVFTHDLDFSAILAINNDNKPSVIQVRIGDISPAVSSHLVINALVAAAAEIEKGALITIDLNKTRLRILPLAGNNFMN